jgi:hypothetical protein
MAARFLFFVVLYKLPIITLAQHLQGSWKWDSTSIRRSLENDYWTNRKTDSHTSIEFKQNGKYRWITYQNEYRNVTSTLDGDTLRVSYKWSSPPEPDKRKRRLKRNVDHGTYEMQGDSLFLSDGSRWHFQLNNGSLYLSITMNLGEYVGVYRLVFVRQRND